MVHSSTLIAILGLGYVLGFLYFGGLWFTLLKLPKIKKPIVFVGWSYFLRLGAVLGIFHIILQRASPDQILTLVLISFFGFLLSRNLLICRINPRDS